MLEHLHLVQLSIPGSCGQLEGRLFYEEHGSRGVGTIVCPPHPLLAGNMDNNVIKAVCLAMAGQMPVLTFNYPAVGKSASPQPELPLFEIWNAWDQQKEYSGIVEEVRQVIRWSYQYFKCYHLVGYSFGACMALGAITRQALSFTAIAPPLAEEDFSSLSALSLPVCIISAEKDDLVNTQLPEADDTPFQKVAIQGADHFFCGNEREVARQIVAFTCSNRTEK